MKMATLLKLPHRKNLHRHQHLKPLRRLHPLLPPNRRRLPHPHLNRHRLPLHQRLPQPHPPRLLRHRLLPTSSLQYRLNTSSPIWTLRLCSRACIPPIRSPIPSSRICSRICSSPTPPIRPILISLRVSAIPRRQLQYAKLIFRSLHPTRVLAPAHPMVQT